MKKVTFCILVFGLCFSLFASGSSENINIAMNKQSQEKIVINPYIVSDSNSIIIMNNLWDGLFEYNPKTSEPDLSLAQSYSVTDNGLTWIFKIKKASFSDGTPITSQTFVTSWNYLIKGRLGSNLNFIERNPDSTLKLDTPDKETLVVHLSYPVSYLPSLLCQVSLAAINPFNALCYSGPYTVKSQTDSKIVLTKNPKYREKVPTDSITILLGSDFSDQFNSGKIQISSSWINDAPQYMITSPVYGTTFFYFNAKTSDIKALSSCVPWEKIKAIIADIIPSSSIVPESSAVFKNQEQSFNNNINQIKIAKYNGDNVNLACEVIQELWINHFNATVLLDTVPVTVYSTNPSLNPYDFCFITWIADYLDPMAFLSLFDSSSTYNLASFSNDDYDELLKKARIQNGNDRLNTLTQAEQLLLDTGTVIPVSQAVVTNFVRNDLIDGWFENPLDIHPFKYLVRK